MPLALTVIAGFVPGPMSSMRQLKRVPLVVLVGTSTSAGPCGTDGAVGAAAGSNVAVGPTTGRDGAVAVGNGVLVAGCVGWRAGAEVALELESLEPHATATIAVSEVAATRKVFLLVKGKDGLRGLDSDAGHRRPRKPF